MNAILLVASGGAIGSVLRYLTGILMTRFFGAAFPYGTLAVNVIGGLLMGLFIELLTRRFEGSEELRLFVAIGILGGFTTFSSFSLDVVLLWQRGEAASAAFYVLLSVVLSIAALFLGLWLARTVA
ncbi:fluoride efflux transporter CrcB [Phyllobacterium sp. YR531]|uniref:fluoride efflux transporter CrcB n=1 Tax=Phyllobacterium sp. YR531 TaxID=1144343 RepID=UPI00026FC35E|nr:fluoride efflux transporter CrcB [Phyllobacterium sp. YR531]EJN04859.1 protein CrcB [Phyllobacterium sp. YR531]